MCRGQGDGMSVEPVDVAVVGVDRLAPLFPADAPNRALLFSVLEGHNRAVVVVDDLDSPSSCAMRTDVFGLTFFSTQDTGFLPAAIPPLRQIGSLELVCPWGSADALKAPDSFQERAKRLDFFDRAPPAPNPPSLPPGCQIKPIDNDLLARCEWRDEFSGTCNPPEAFFESSPGICLVRADDILCEAYAAWWGNGVCEIGVVTPAPHRGQGYAALTCEHLARSCEALGFQTNWTCHEVNAGSVAVARRLGFRSEIPYELLVYKAA